MPTREIAIYDESYEANGDLSGNQYHGVGFTGSTMRIILGGASTTFGILQNKPAAAGEQCQVRHHGISRMVVNGSGTPIVRGSPIQANSGVGIVATIGTVAVGTALQPSTVNGDVVSVLLTGTFRMHA